MPVGGDSDSPKRETYAVIAARYCVTERTAKRWMAHGKQCKEAPPFHDPAGMIAWWSRWMVQRPPAGLMDALSMVDQPKTAAPEEKEPTAPSVPAPDRETGLIPELARLEDLAVTLSVKAHEPGQAKPYLDTVARMTSLTKQMREEAERMKKLLPKDLVETAIHEFHGPIEREVRLLYKTLCEITGLPHSPDNEAKWHREIDKLFIRFSGEIFV